jgi:hypothetical protein
MLPCRDPCFLTSPENHPWLQSGPLMQALIKHRATQATLPVSSPHLFKGIIGLECCHPYLGRGPLTGNCQGSDLRWWLIGHFIDIGFQRPLQIDAPHTYNRS